MATTITGANQQTQWWNLSAVAASICFLLTGDFVDPVGIRYSNNDAIDKGTDYTTDATTYSAASGPLELPFGIAKYVAFFSGSAWTSGKTCRPSFAKGKDPNGQLVDVGPQSAGGAAGIG